MSLKIMDRVQRYSRKNERIRPPIKGTILNGNESSSNHQFSGDMLVFRGVRIVFLPFSSFLRGEPLCASLGFRIILEVFVLPNKMGPW